MRVQISNDRMTGDLTGHTAARATAEAGWIVSWLPGRTVDRNQSITALVLAEYVARHWDAARGEPVDIRPRAFLALVHGWADELGLTRESAIDMICRAGAL